MNVKRWDNVVHVILCEDPEHPQVDSEGRRVANAYVVTAVCGRHAKINDYGRNKLTEDAPTCIVCVAGGYLDE